MHVTDMVLSLTSSEKSLLACSGTDECRLEVARVQREIADRHLEQARCAFQLTSLQIMLS